ncbi:tripartite tricarboxylate transporter permease [Desulfogranum mediterraneum]|uniref:tripartite tricarboxylate transporter permease n=1 Tax=Desulfogranum mediterraneum TaxID=160661 RepID=UPI000401D9DC|nr:tripartite tricarboxylate transporter permease [Desulfogranum mediterraneum]
MIAEILSGLMSIFSLGPLTGIAVGVLTGLIFGAIPGISGIMAIAILLPMTFYVSPLIGIPMLLGIYKAGIFGGSISAILLNTPGAPPAVCTAMEGYPLTRKGQAGKALNTALSASVFGDVFSNLLLIFVAAPLSIITLKAGPAERFSIIVLALTVVGSISGPSIIKGIICAGVGIWLSTIGISETTGATRFVFGSSELIGGISLIPMVIGLLCLPEVLQQVGQAYTAKKKKRLTLSQNREDNRFTLRDFRYCLPTMIKSSFIGSFLGALPGLGASPAAFMAYSEAQRSSKRPEKFNRGAIDGLAAPEAANNATTGSAMIPMLTLGIPGDDVTAILMGAFLIQGITPGPTIFYEHTHLIYGIFGGLLMCDLFLYLIAKMGFNLWIKLSQAPKHLIFSCVTVFCFVGAYSINQSLFDIFTLIIFAIVGFLMKRYHFSAGAFIIGFILGPIWERAFDQAMVISDGSYSIFFTRPIPAIFLFLALVSIISITRTRMKTNKLAMEVDQLKASDQPNN